MNQGYAFKFCGTGLEQSNVKGWQDRSVQTNMNRG